MSAPITQAAIINTKCAYRKSESKHSEMGPVRQNLIHVTKDTFSDKVSRIPHGVANVMFS